MKNILLILIVGLLPMLASADAVEIDGIYYNLVEKAKVAEVASNPNKYTGDIVIPEKVTYNEMEYNVTSIGYAFRHCGDLNSVIIPNSVTSIGEFAFQYCSKLTSITIPNSIISIGDYSFYQCVSLISITIPNGVTSIGGGAFQGCSGLTSIIIPNSVISIGGSAFHGCSGLTSIIISNSVTTIGSYTFSKCRDLTSVTIPNSVTRIKNYAFKDCSCLNNVTIGTNIKQIDAKVFANCPELANIYCYAENVPSTNFDVFENSYIDYITLHVPGTSIEAYNSQTPWKDFKKIVALENDDPNPTNIKAFNYKTSSAIFNLNGLYNCSHKGLKIINGKKIIVK